MAVLCSLLLLVSAFLLFSIQPMVAKMLLPILGGSPSVWNTAMVFYQAALLGGYLYSHLLTKMLDFKRQLIVHAVVLALPLFVLPLYYGDLHPPIGANPIPWMLLTMALSVGLPFFVLSASSPLIQSWFSRTGNKDPYFLYAASNVGSFLGLLSYPFLIEPKFAVGQQSGAWTWGYVALAVLFAITALKLRPMVIANQAEEEAITPEPLAWTRRLKWVFLAFVPSSQFIGVTTYLTTDIAVMPLLWVIPLAIYLLTMIFVFAKKPPIPHKAIVAVFPFVLAYLTFISIIKVTNQESLLFQVTGSHAAVFTTHLLMLFIGAMLCHGELAKDRPSPARLTEFFLWMSFGGVLGGIFNAIVAPMIFVQVIEYTVLLVVLCFALPPRVKGWKPSLLALDFFTPILIGGGTLGMLYLMNEYGMMSRQTFVPLLTGVGCLACIVCAARPLRLGLSIGAMFLVGIYNFNTIRKTVFAARSFFGVHRVESIGKPKTGVTNSLINGRILHGKQVLFDERMETMPLTYYHPNGPLKEVFGAWKRPAGAHVGIVGLGVGSTAMWSRPGEDWTFYEIDELVEQLARDPKLFTYLAKAPAPQKVLIGDARLRLNEAPDGSYDVLAIDAFSSDSIPAHLMTTEAFQLYRRKLKPNGLLAVHISNKFLDLEPLVAAITDSLNLKTLVCRETEMNPMGEFALTGMYAGAAALQPTTKTDYPWLVSQRDSGRAVATWCIVGPRSMDCSVFDHAKRWSPARRREGIEAWTDDYSSLLPLMRM